MCECGPALIFRCWLAVGAQRAVRGIAPMPLRSLRGREAETEKWPSGKAGRRGSHGGVTGGVVLSCWLSAPSASQADEMRPRRLGKGADWVPGRTIQKGLVLGLVLLPISANWTVLVRYSFGLFFFKLFLISKPINFPMWAIWQVFFIGFIIFNLVGCKFIHPLQVCHHCIFVLTLQFFVKILKKNEGGQIISG